MQWSRYREELGAQGRPLTEWFLIDTGADQTVLSGAVRFRLGILGGRRIATR
jgi:hypothetical protein